MLGLGLPMPMQDQRGGGRPGWVLPGSTVDLYFSQGLYYGGNLTDLLSTSRTSTAYAQTLAGLLVSFPANTLRVTDQGALIEEARTNSQTYSVPITGQWTAQSGGTGVAATITYNYGVAPNGTTTAARAQLDKGAGSTSSDFAQFFGPATAIADGNYVSSLWVKTNDGSTKTVSLRTGGTSIGAITVTGVWQRFTQASIFASQLTSVGVRLRGGTEATSQTADLLVWGAQTELGAFSTSYIPTTTTSATRAADVVTLIGLANTVAIGTSGWGVVKTSTGNYVASAFLLGGSGASDYYLRQGSGGATTIQARMGGAGSGTATIGGGASLGTGTVKSGVSWNSSGFIVVGNNGTQAPVTQALSLPASVYFGSRNGTSVSSMYFPRLTLGNQDIGAAIGALTA